MLRLRPTFARPVLAAASLLAAGCPPPSAKDLLPFLPKPTTTDDSSGGESSSDGASTGGGSSTGGGGSDSGSTDSSDSAAMTSTSTGDVTPSTSTGTTTTSGGEPVCGDGVVEGDEECEFPDKHCFNCALDRWMFVTAALVDTNLGGIAGADSLCRQWAQNSPRSPENWKTFKAWISDSKHDMRDRLPPNIRGRVVRTDGQPVVESAEDLFSGQLLAPINIDENGDLAEGGVLTGTRPDGTAVDTSPCEDWTSSSLLHMTSYTGAASATNEYWTLRKVGNPQGCGGMNNRLYCLEAW